MPTLAVPPAVAVKSLVVVVASPPPASPKRLANRLTVAVFLLFLLVPLVGSVMRPTQVPNEKRPPHPAPYFPDERWKAQVFPFLFDAYFGDRTGFRRELLRLRQAVVVERLGDSISDMVWMGRDGWLFVNCTGPTGLPAAQIDTGPQLDRWAAAFEERRRWLADRGCRYVVMVAPEKSSVYPEHLPAWAKRHPPPDHLGGLKPRVPTVPLIDPLPAILAAKTADGPDVYYRTDSHWTDTGAFAAYTELGRWLERELPGYRAKTKSDFDRVPTMMNGRDLAIMIGRREEECVEPTLLFQDRAGPPTLYPADRVVAMMERRPDFQRQLPVRVAGSSRGVGRAVLLHDSFGEALFHLLPTDFGRLTTIGTYGFPTDILEEERPDVVIQLLVARTLSFVPPPRPTTMTP